jgi:hypothetical protein
MKRSSSPRQVVGTEDKSLDPLTARDSVDDFRHVRHGDAAIKEMIGFDQNADSARALVEATRGANASLDPG